MEWQIGNGAPKDGRWIVELFEDGSGAQLWAFYEDEHGQVGWHDQYGAFDLTAQLSDEAIWIEAPTGFLGRIGRY